MVNIDKLKAKIIENGITVEVLAEKLNMNRATLYRKIQGKGDSFKIKEADNIAKELKLSGKEASEIFFSQYVA